MRYFVLWMDYAGGLYLQEFVDKQSCVAWINSKANIENNNEFEIKKIIAGQEKAFRPVRIVTEYEID